jgi:predicted Zn-dependent protease
VKPYPEEMLRLVNGYYPKGEPEPGEWIKVFR